MKEALFPLICAGLYERNFKKFPELTPKQWAAVVSMAHRQTVTGILSRGITHLPKDYPLPEDILLKLVAEAETIQRQGRKVQQVADTLTARFQAEGLHPIIMKGPEVARFYPEPLLRECGDLDLYFKPDEIDQALKAAGTVEKAPDGSFHFLEDGINIDVHRKYFNLSTKHVPAVPSPEATLLMLSAHILKHCMGPGIGLRQLCDMAMAYKALQVPPEQLRQCFREAGLERWNKLLFSFLNKYLCAEALYDELPDPKPLLDIILEGGNFGHYAATRGAAISKGPFRRKLDTARRYLKRLPVSFKYAPREVLPAIGELISGNLS